MPSHSTLSHQVQDPDETVDLETLMEKVVPNHEIWKQTPNPVLGGEKPEDLIGSPKEQILRDLLRTAKHGMMS